MAGNIDHAPGARVTYTFGKCILYSPKTLSSFQGTAGMSFGFLISGLCDSQVCNSVISPLIQFRTLSLAL